jgi:hypothetical protein
MPTPKRSAGKSKKVSFSAAFWQNIQTQDRERREREDEARARREQRDIELLKLSRPSGKILPGCDRVPLEDLAIRWNVSPSMIKDSAQKGIFDIVITEDEIVEHWYLSRARWPHGQKQFFITPARTVHHLVKPPLRWSPAVKFYFPIEEVKRLEREGGLAGQPSLTIKEYAYRNNISEKTVRRRIQENNLPGAHKVGGSWRIGLNPLS